MWLCYYLRFAAFSSGFPKINRSTSSLEIMRNFALKWANSKSKNSHNSIFHPCEVSIIIYGVHLLTKYLSSFHSCVLWD